MYYDVHCHKSNNIPDISSIINLDLCNNIQIDKDKYYSVGIHPWHIKSSSKQLLDVIEKNILEQNIIALGEIGLDKKCTTSYAEQIVFFAEQIKIADSINKPIIIHCVKAYQEIIEYRKNSTVPWIIHGFNGSEKLAEQLINKNIYLSFGKTILNRKSKSFRFFSHIPLESIFLETDIHNVNIKDIYKQAAKLKNISINDMVNQIQINFEKVFKITNE
ncbi:MAG TPA: TatD family hydrolase [Victivallales bacterium]|nr:TatD family hydrolase [Victivallales bacterium]